MRITFLGLVALAAVVLSGCGADRPAPRAAGVVGAIDRPDGNPLNNAYFGDLHVHTALSIDAYILGTRQTPEQAYRFARGEMTTTALGETIQLAQPLDFVALTDHAENFHLYQICAEEKGTPLYRSRACENMRTPDVGLKAILPGGDGGRQPANCPGGTEEGCWQAAKRTWQRVVSDAERANDPGKFTAFIAYEYSASRPGGGLATAHMHRNVIFAGSDVPDHAESALDSKRNVELWKWLERSCTGPCDVVAIPHNSNFSWGYAFALETQDNKAYTTDDWARRARFERLVEIFQIKGNSECAIGYGTTDEECGFESMPYPACTATSGERCYAEGSFVRNALKSGLKLGKLLGFNPYKVGFIGSGDNHNGTPGATPEDRYVGATSLADGSTDLRLGKPAVAGKGEQMSLGAPLLRNPGGLAGVWAPENTRAALFASLKRRETFATSGTRMRVRFFGGWALPANLANRPDFVAAAYRTAVPMGGDLPPAIRAMAPSFLIWAARDPLAAPLQRIQVVKGWTEGDTAREAVYDVACSDGLSPDPKTHRCPSNGATVDLSNCSISAGKGAAELKSVWRDPDFDPARPAFYYVRVYENPSCRWNAIQALRSGRPIAPFPGPVIQERAWSSPIWYEPRA